MEIHSPIASAKKDSASDEHVRVSCKGTDNQGENCPDQNRQLTPKTIIDESDEWWQNNLGEAFMQEKSVTRNQPL
jgi:hypothetical protein